MLKKLTLVLIFIFTFTLSVDLFAQLNQQITQLSPINAVRNTGEKPQSKVWKHDGIWWTILPMSGGTYLYKLDVNSASWTQELEVSSLLRTHADCKVYGDTVHAILFQSDRTESKLVSLEYNSVNQSYGLWSVRSSLVDISHTTNVTTMTIDIDSNGRMWLAYVENDDVKVRWSNRPYSSFSSPIILESNVSSSTEEICAITAFGGDKMGVLWSNQVAEQFQFRYRNDSESDLTIWIPKEIAASNQDGNGIADDHINLAVDPSDGSIYAAVKTSFDNPLPSTYPIIGLLKRNSSGSWDNLYTVDTDKDATRPIVLLNTSSSRLYVIYTEKNGGNVYVRESLISSINFGPRITLKSGSYNDVTSIKESYTNDITILFSSSSSGSFPYKVEGFYSSDGALPVELASFTGKIINGKVNLIWRTETEVDNYGFEIQRSAEGIRNSEDWEIIGFVEGHGNSNSPKNYSFQDNPFPRASSLYYRLKQIDTDGQFEYSESIEVKFDVLEQFVLYQNYPNPFNPTTKISWYAPYSTQHSIKLFDILGNEVAVLFDEFREAGSYEIEFNAEGLSSGVYFYQLKAGDFIESKKMIISK